MSDTHRRDELLPPVTGRITRRCCGLLGLTSTLLSGFQTAGKDGKSPAARIEFTKIPQAVRDGRDQHDIIEGTVAGARPEQQIVLYAKSGQWWVQPLATSPLTRIQANAQWHNATHLGTEYAALLVEPGYRPAPVIDTLPGVGGPVLAVAVTPGAKNSPAVSLQFSGYEWKVRSAPSTRGGRNNPYAAENAWLDPSGALHLRAKQVGGECSCAELRLTRSLGYGTYSFTVQDLSHLPPGIEFEMFTWDYSGTDQNNREMDIAIRRPRDRSKTNGRFMVQPYHVAANEERFQAPSGPLTYSFRWEPGRVSFLVSSSKGRPKQTIAEHVFTVGVPSPGVESVRLALFLTSPTGSELPPDSEVVVNRFAYLP